MRTTVPCQEEELSSQITAFGQRSQRIHGHKQGGRARGRIVTYAATEAAECIAKGQEKYNAGDRMGALKFFEQSLQKSPTQQERQAALFNSTAVHASFGDVELAQITLREGISYGLDFKKALKDSEDSQLVKFQGSPQIVIQLQKFAEAVKRIKGAVGSVNDKKAPAAKPASSGKSAYSSDTMFGRDISSILSTDLTDIDPSVGGIVKRVAGLLVVGLVLAVVLFYVGLRFTFPEQF
ncbi:g155 [Coccomyxa viridis]|uniref:G155 protein n=1 Tax=Coccomyxa viridis TaxID=1274662 RepID=A0ABP1FGP4_9CHLO